MSINRERLFRLERLGLFNPVFRVKTPHKKTAPLMLPISKRDRWFSEGWAWDTTRVPPNYYTVPEIKDGEQEAYYSIFQIYHLVVVISEMTLSLNLDGFFDCLNEKPVDWDKNGKNWMKYANDRLASLTTHEHRRSVALVCQFISDRYYPNAQSDQRTIQNPSGRQSFDQWTSIGAYDWDWLEYSRSWNPKRVEEKFKLTREKLKHAYTGLAVSQSYTDPLENWYQLTQFVAVRERLRLKGDALHAETLRSAAYMLRMLYKDLYGEELPHPNEVTGTIITHIPEKEIRSDTRRYLEFVVNRYNLNPQPRVTVFVEGESEEKATKIIFEEYFGTHPGKYGIEVVCLQAVDTATGGKEDRFRAILRLMDYLHHHQTFTFLILDNENYAKRLKAEARKAKSIHHKKRYITRSEYIKIWRNSFEFDNYSATEISSAMNDLAKGTAKFSRFDVAGCKKLKNPGSALSDLYKQRTSYSLEKVKLNEILVRAMLSVKKGKNVADRPIIKTSERVARLANRNLLPTMQEIWEINQASRYLGKKLRA